MGRVYILQADFARASQMLARSAEQMHRLGNMSEEATAAGFAGYAFGFLGEFEQALAYVNHGIRLAQELQNPFAEAAAYQYRANVHDQRGAWAQAITDFEAARRIAERVGDRFRVYLVKFFEGRAHTMAGDPARGRVLLEESFALAEQLGTTFGLVYAKAFFTACLLALGEFAAVPPLCYEAIHLAEAAGDQFHNALAHRTLAEALCSLKPVDPQRVEDAIQEAIRLQQEIDAKPELARTYVSYARLLQGQEQGDKANAYLIQAIGMFQQMDMAWDLAQAERALHALP